jgi:hypothetical protein
MTITILEPTIIPGSEFEIRSTEDLKFGTPEHYIVCKKRLGLWHKPSSSWVSLDRDDKDIKAPYDPVGGSDALEMILECGLYGFLPVHSFN